MNEWRDSFPKLVHTETNRRHQCRQVKSASDRNVSASLYRTELCLGNEGAIDVKIGSAGDLLRSILVCCD